MDTGKGEIASRLVADFDLSQEELKNKQLRFAMSPEDYIEILVAKRMLMARNILLERAYVGSHWSSASRVTTYIPAENDPRWAIEGNVTIYRDHGDPQKTDESFLPTQLIVRARAVDTFTQTKSNEEFLGFVVLPRRKAPYMNLGHDCYSKKVELSDDKNTPSGEIVEIIDSAIVDVLNRDAAIRRALGKDALSTACED